MEGEKQAGAQLCFLEESGTFSSRAFDGLSRLQPSPAQREHAAKAEGIAFALAAAPEKGYDLEELRRWARWFCHSNQSMREIHIPGVVWMDKVREQFGIRPLAGRGNNFLGGLFSRDFEPTGEFITSKTAGSHGNRIMLWRLKTNLKKEACNGEESRG